jgi:AraC-like DNA-binding protein
VIDFQIHKPSAALAPLVRCYWTLSGSGGEPQTIFPDGCPEIVIQYGDPVMQGRRAQPRAILVGQMRSPVKITPGPKVQSFGIRLRPAGAYALFRFAQSEILDRIVALDDVDGATAHALASTAPMLGPGCGRRKSLDAARTSAYTTIEGALMGLMRTAADQRVDAAIDCIVRTHGCTTMDRVAAHAGISTRQLERLFQMQVGLDPKTFSRIVRFQNLTNLRPQSWAAMAAEGGYFDQAHLIRDFRQFAGQTPSEWAASRVVFLQDSASHAR